LAIALKDPLTNFVGWIFYCSVNHLWLAIGCKLAKTQAMLFDIRIFQFTILEIGNWVDADQSTGRIIHIPNGKVFNLPQANYTSGFDYIWNEIPVRITFESDHLKTKSILQEIANKYSQTIIKDAESKILEASKTYLIYYKNLTPIVYTKVKDYGIQLTIRYLCNPRRRRGSEHEIWEEIIAMFKQHPDIQFAYPTTRFYKTDES
jgi:small-conductance mechanosensitive channel